MAYSAGFLAHTELQEKSMDNLRLQKAVLEEEEEADLLSEQMKGTETRLRA